MTLDDIRCKTCKSYRKIYIHPWSKCPEYLKGSRLGFACLLFAEKSALTDEPQIDVTLCREDSVGCECWSAKEASE